MRHTEYGYVSPVENHCYRDLERWLADKKKWGNGYPMMMKHCNWGGCNKVVPKDQSFCDKHEAMNEQRKADYKASLNHRDQTSIGRQVRKDHQAYYNRVRRDKEANTFYHTKQWRNVRDYVYARDMATCQVCGNAVTNRKIVDHIHPLKVSGEERLSQDNLWTLCYRCHNIKTNLEMKIATKDNGNAILKHAKREWWQKIISERFK